MKQHFFKLVCVAAMLAAVIFILPSLKKQTKTTTPGYASIEKGK